MASAVKQKKKHVCVAVRVRPVNDVESADSSHKVAVTVDERQRFISVKDKRFAGYDRVYGQNATQVQLYSDLVAPLVDDVLAGYNCTVFAYGQTSTGKTFTMEGEHEEALMQTWHDDTKAGIIPRVLDHIFGRLEEQELEEYSLRVSYIELYNEELYDLLSVQSDDASAAVQRLRIFEDPQKKGSVVIAGLEEVPVKRRNEVFALLKRGAEKRQTASTLMNLRSSRSHTVFTVSVMVRENTLDGEELLKQGKLHLVDLAGSENIGRSGAIEKRAREAGLINQSLLTLGRVITALVSQAAHVPYRESKLTRILQDSLGGRTLTTLIATVSPSSVNYEETVSTLEYALKSKSIKNTPEINQKVSRRAHLKELNEEIDRLRRDLAAAWERNGVTLDKENYETMTKGMEEQRARIEELEGQLDVMLERVKQFTEDMIQLEEHYRQAYHRNMVYREKIEKRRVEVEVQKQELLKARNVISALEEVLSLTQDTNTELREQAEKLKIVYAALHKTLESFEADAIVRVDAAEEAHDRAGVVNTEADSSISKAIHSQKLTTEQRFEESCSKWKSHLEALKARAVKAREADAERALQEETADDELFAKMSQIANDLAGGTTRGEELVASLFSLFATHTANVDSVTSEQAKQIKRLTEEGRAYAEKQKTERTEHIDLQQNHMEILASTLAKMREELESERARTKVNRDVHMNREMDIERNAATLESSVHELTKGVRLRLQDEHGKFNELINYVKTKTVDVKTLADDERCTRKEKRVAWTTEMEQQRSEELELFARQTIQGVETLEHWKNDGHQIANDIDAKEKLVQSSADLETATTSLKKALGDLTNVCKDLINPEHVSIAEMVDVEEEKKKRLRAPRMSEFATRESLYGLEELPHPDDLRYGAFDKVTPRRKIARRSSTDEEED